MDIDEYQKASLAGNFKGKFLNLNGANISHQEVCKHFFLTYSAADSDKSKNSGQINQNPGDKIPFRNGTRDMGSFVIYVYPNNRNSTIHPMLIIAKAGIPDILEIKKIGREKILVVKTVSSSKFKPLDPNRLVENTSFPKHNLPAFIPAFKILRHYNTDIITLYVPQQIDLDTLKECIESPKAKVLDVQRLNRRSVRDGKMEYIPGQYVQNLQDNCRKRSSYTRLDMRFAPLFLDRGCAIFIIEWDTLAVRVRADVCIAAKISIICAAPIRKLLNVLILTVIGLMIITALSANSVLLSAVENISIADADRNYQRQIFVFFFSFLVLQ